MKIQISNNRNYIPKLKGMSASFSKVSILLNLKG